MMVGFNKKAKKHGSRLGGLSEGWIIHGLPLDTDHS